MSLRLHSGDLRGRRIEVPKGIRPTESRVREALFSIWRDQVPDCRFLDLFAGSGAVGLEAWSLGARSVCFVDQASPVLAILRRNLESASGEGDRRRREIVRGKLPEALERRLTGPFDLLFADPPYAFSRYDDLLTGMKAKASAAAEIAIEHSIRTEINQGETPWSCHDQRRYGESCISFFKAVEQG